MEQKTYKIAVLGANGRSGSIFVDKALKHGYFVRAGVYGSEFPARDNLEIVRCNVMDQNDISKICEEVDAVISLIGHGPKSPADLQQVAIRNIIQALKNQPAVRVISLTGTGVRCEGDMPNLIDKFLNFGIQKVDPLRISDGIKHVDILRNSSLDWTVVRVLKLTNGSHNGIVEMNLAGPAELFTPRARVASAIIKILDEDLYHKQCPIIIGHKKGEK
jgi:putative NADH-flavin reductase